MPISIILLLAGLTFGWFAVSGIRKGEVRVPLHLISADSYDREHTLYWGIIGLNLVLSAGALLLAYVIHAKGF